MKIATVTLAVISLILLGCASDPVSVSSTNNKDIQVELLFVHDGCSVYRFMDDGHYVYYTVCDNSRSTTAWNENQGKTTIHRQVDTNYINSRPVEK
jgi:hypothetical protein